jgi:hypothetical protein
MDPSHFYIPGAELPSAGGSLAGTTEKQEPIPVTQVNNAGKTSSATESGG